MRRWLFDVRLVAVDDVAVQHDALKERGMFLFEMCCLYDNSE